MADLFDQKETSFSENLSETKARKPGNGISKRYVVLIAAAVMMFLWGAWVTKGVLATQDGQQDFVQLQLQGIISEYLQAQARSGTDEETAARETAAFMQTVDETVKGLSASGKVVLVHEAVIGGDIPDITESVKSAVYEKVKKPQALASAGVQGKMEAYMAANAGGQDGVAR